MNSIEPPIRWLNTIHLDEISTTGGKNANLGELIQISKDIGFLVPDGFAVVASAYDGFLKFNGLHDRIEALIHEDESGKTIRELIRNAQLPDDLIRSITLAYEQLTQSRKGRMDVAVRSSATAEDLPTASFAGLQDSYLNINGIQNLLQSILHCYASLFNERAISYRHEKKIQHSAVRISVAVQEMIRSDLSVSGVLFTIDPESGFENHILIESSYGLGESIVQGKVNPDEFIVFKPLLESTYLPIIQKKCGSKDHKIVYAGSHDDESVNAKSTVTIPVEVSARQQFTLSDTEILRLAHWAKKIESHYSSQYAKPTPMDIEWAKDGISGELYIVQARPETVHSQHHLEKSRWQNFQLLEKSRLVIEGCSIGNSIHAGHARIIDSPQDLSQLKWGEILVTDKTDPDWEPIMKKASAIITNRGGRTCHAAIVARELGLPAVVGTDHATQVIHTGDPITVSSAEGSIGKVYEGILPIRIQAIPEVNLNKIHTSVFMNVSDPDEAANLSFLPNHGVGLARLEFIINSSLRIHPMAIAHFSELKDPELIATIQKISVSYSNPEDFFVSTLAQKTAMITAAFYPKPVLVRFSDFKSNEYSRLIGGKEYEPIEENPMIGFRGAIRYADDHYRSGFALECKAMLKVRNEMGFQNLRLMIPFCRTLDEAHLVIQELEKNGITRRSGFQIWMMCEIPSNIMLADEFLDLFDGFSIGSNDLTQLVLGIDRDSDRMAASFSELNPAVTKMISMVIQSARRKNKSIGICGEAPSNHPEFAAFLIQEGIQSLSLNPDSILRTLPIILEAEKHQASPLHESSPHLYQANPGAGG